MIELISKYIKEWKNNNLQKINTEQTETIVLKEEDTIFQFDDE